MPSPSARSALREPGETEPADAACLSPRTCEGEGEEMEGSIISVVAPYRDESLHGLLARVIRANVYDRIAWLREAVGIPNDYQDLWSVAQCDALARLLGLPVEEVRRRAYTTDGNGYTFFGHRLTRKQFEWGRRKVCPACLNEFGYHSAVLELSAVQVCPLHAVRLRTTCHACRKRLRWSTPSVTRCSNCRADQRRAPLEAVPVDELGGIAAVAGMAGFPRLHPDLEARGAGLPPGLAHLDLGEFQTLAVRLGLYIQSGRRSWQGHALNNAREAHRVVDAAWRVLRDWPANFFRLLREVSGMDEEVPRHTAGIHRAFRRLYDYPVSQKGEPWLTLQKALREFANHRWDGLVMPRADAAIPVVTGMISETEVARRIGVAKARALIGSGAVYGEVVYARSGAGRTSKVFVDREGLDRLCPEGVIPLDLRAASRRLGLSEILTKRLADHGILPPLDGPPVSMSRRYLFVVPDIERLIARFETRLAPSSDDGSRVVGFGTLLKAQGELNLPLPEVMRAILEGSLPPVARGADARGLAAYRFDEQTMRASFREIGERTSAFANLARADVVRRLGCRKDTVAWLVANGYLAEIPGFGRQKPISRASLEAFQGGWIKAGEVAERFGTSRMLVSRALKAAGVTATEPASEAITVFHDRGQVEALDVASWIDKVALHRGKAWSEYATSLEARSHTKQASKPLA